MFLPISNGSRHACRYPLEAVLSTQNPRLVSTLSQRRSQRILLSVSVQVTGTRPNGSEFEEATTTLVVNAHGALLQLREPLKLEQEIRVKNMQTGEQVSCVVRDVGNAEAARGAEVGVEFCQPQPRFWSVAFPPADWSPRSPEAKRFASSNAVTPKSRG